ncbi:hypothetical protein OAI88_00455 [Nitrosopumilus sp.]|nr:hypothetical protein [Nitrosopumilus sp.]
MILTFVINYYHEQNHPDMEFNYAYIPGIVMLISFGASFILFTKNNL